MFDIRKFFISLHLVAAAFSFYGPALAAPEPAAEVQGFSKDTRCKFKNTPYISLTKLTSGKTVPGFAGVIPGQVQYHCKMNVICDFPKIAYDPLFTAPAQRFLCIDPQHVNNPIWRKAEEMTNVHRLYNCPTVCLQCTEIIHTPIEVFSIKTDPGFSWEIEVESNKYYCNDKYAYVYIPMPSYQTLEMKRYEEKEALVRTTLEAEERGAYEALPNLEKMMFQETKAKMKQRVASTRKQLNGTESEEASYRTQIVDTETEVRNVLHTWATESAKQAKTIATLNEIANDSIQSKLEMAEKLDNATTNKKGSWLGWTS